MIKKYRFSNIFVTVCLHFPFAVIVYSVPDLCEFVQLMAKCVPIVVGMTILQEYVLNSLQNFNNQNNTSIHDIEVEVEEVIKSITSIIQYHQQPIHALGDTENEYCTDNYENMVPLYSLESLRQDIHHVGARPANKYFATLHTSSIGRHFHHIKFQIDTAATCNTMSESTIQHNFSDAQITLLIISIWK